MNATTFVGKNAVMKRLRKVSLKYAATIQGTAKSRYFLADLKINENKAIKSVIITAKTMLLAIKNVSAMSMLATIAVRETKKLICSILFKKIPSEFSDECTEKS